MTPTELATWVAEDRRHEYADDVRDDALHDLLNDMAWEDGGGE